MDSLHGRTDPIIAPIPAAQIKAKGKFCADKQPLYLRKETLQVRLFDNNLGVFFPLSHARHEVTDKTSLYMREGQMGYREKVLDGHTHLIEQAIQAAQRNRMVEDSGNGDLATPGADTTERTHHLGTG